jgi:hypothetical protein
VYYAVYDRQIGAWQEAYSPSPGLDSYDVADLMVVNGVVKWRMYASGQQDINFCRIYVGSWSACSDIGTITGYVYESDGNTSISDVCVGFYTNECNDLIRQRVGHTDTNGNYSVILPSGNYYVNTNASCQTQQNFFLNEW